MSFWFVKLRLVCEYQYYCAEMKKMLNLFNKKKRLSVKSDRIESDAVPEPPRNLPQYSPVRSELYNNFNNDDCCIKSNLQSTQETNDTENNEGLVMSSESAAVIAKEERIHHYPNRDPLLADVESMPSSLACGNDSYQTTAAVEDVSISTFNTSLNSLLPESNNRAVNRLIGNNNCNKDNLSLKEYNSNPNSNIPKSMGKDKKTGGNTYVITISNSAHFHIGPQKTVNYPQLNNDNLTKQDLELAAKCKKIALNGNNNNDSNSALDLKDMLSEDDVLQISLNVQEKWREFARNLGVDETVMDELEDLYDNDYNLVVFDVLKQYLSRYPGTTVGYMINVLRKCGETNAIQKLLEKR